MKNINCECGGYWDWVNDENSLYPKPNHIPVGLNDPNEINGWVWEYTCQDCNEKNVDFDSLIARSKLIDEFAMLGLFPGPGASSSSGSSSSGSSSSGSSSSGSSSSGSSSSDSSSSSSSDCPCGPGAECCGSKGAPGVTGSTAQGCSKTPHPCARCGGGAGSCEPPPEWENLGCCGGKCCSNCGGTCVPNPFYHPGPYQNDPRGMNGHLHNICDGSNKCDGCLGSNACNN